MDDLNNKIEEEKQTGASSKTPDSLTEPGANAEPEIAEKKPDAENPEVYTPVVEPVADDEELIEETAPTLYSERVIYVFSVLFSVLAGGILMARNLKEVGRKDGIPHVIAFSLIYTFLSGYFMNVSKFGLVGTVLLAVIGSMVLTSYFWNAYIGKGIAYYPKSYRKALIITILILIPLFLILAWNAATTGQLPTDSGLRID
jgi:hypothetical protein